MDLQIAPTNKEQIVLVDKMLALITGGKTTGMDKQEEYTMTKALQLYRGYLTGKETITAKVPIKIKAPRIVHANPDCKDASRCKPHGETGKVFYREKNEHPRLKN